MPPVALNASLLHPPLICTAFHEMFPPSGAVGIAGHGARTLRREAFIRLWQMQAVRGPVAAGVIETVGERPALGIRPGQDVVLILGSFLP